MKKVWVVEWEEWDDGWMRPDGTSLHTSKGKMDKYIKGNSEWHDDKHHDYPTATYEKEVTDDLYNEVKANSGTKRYFEKPW